MTRGGDRGTQPLADYLSQLGDYGITEGQVRIASSTDEMAKLLANGEVDLYFDSTYPATLVSDQAGAKVILRRWRFGVDEYQGVIFASLASGINPLMICPPYGRDGRAIFHLRFFLPAVHLLENGLTLTGKKSYGDPVANDEIGFVFSYDDSNTLQWVLSGLTDAGVTDDYNFDVAFPEDAKAQLVELTRTEYTPRQVAVIRSGLDEELVQAIVQVLTTMHETGAARPR
jgi:phosphonate transport system substrate-binding protein